MSGESKGFEISPDDLLAVAQKVQGLLDDVNGDSGAYPGNYQTFAAQASTANVKGALDSLFPANSPPTAFTSAYDWEFKGLDKKYQAIIGQLTALQSACRTTAEEHGASDDETQAAINAMNQGMP